MNNSNDAVVREVSDWFFEDYVPTWVGVGSGSSSESAEFILRYWGVPMFVCAPALNTWLLDSQSVLQFLEMNHAPLREAGYSHTVIPDRKVTVYHDEGAAIEVIWSRRAADETEIQRWAVHFELRKSDGIWKVAGVQGTETSSSSLDEVWRR